MEFSSEFQVYLVYNLYIYGTLSYHIHCNFTHDNFWGIYEDLSFKLNTKMFPLHFSLMEKESIDEHFFRDFNIKLLITQLVDYNRLY